MTLDNNDSLSNSRTNQGRTRHISIVVVLASTRLTAIRLRDDIYSLDLSWIQVLGQFISISQRKGRVEEI